MPGPGDFGAATIAWITVVMLLSGFAHGVIGFGFPLIATPLLLLAVDLKVAIVVSIVANLALTTLNAFHGGALRESIGRFWFLPLCLAVGSYLGTRLLIVAPSEPFLLLLALIVLGFLNLDRLGRTDAPAVRRHPVAFAIAFGVVAGVFEATANVAGPVLLVLFLLLGMPPRPLVQLLNFSFIAGKGVQMATWTVNGGITAAQWLVTVPWGFVAVAGLLAGRRVHRRVGTETYARWLRRFLWVMAALLIAQFGLAMAKRIA
jgi:uncharacterized membrane protein YfcA